MCLEALLFSYIGSNGLLDPWHGGGVLHSIPEQNITAFVIPEGAHHLDLRSTNMADPVGAIAARSGELITIAWWIDQYCKKLSLQYCEK